MRESRKTEKTHLPRDSMEDWLESQTPTPKEVEHRNAPEDTYEVWMKKMVGESRARKSEPKPSGQN